MALPRLGDPRVEADMPFDEFTIRQLAGDMLDNPTPDDLIATGFHRNTMLNEEGASIRLSFVIWPWSIEWQPREQHG